ncbi:hypothetical protein ACFWVC_00165 [Streptomyces sp. NPDC058691]|uniref:hypothetical protein n=1 Tax=Streptomyces sp. NPDC058691 TaxID=3346601 RepID=UPI00365CAC13
MPAMNVPFDEDDDLRAVTEAAAAAGVSTRQFIRDAALDRALAKPRAFLAAALAEQDRIAAVWAEHDPEDARPDPARHAAEAEAAAALAAMDNARGTAA